MNNQDAFDKVVAHLRTMLPNEERACNSEGCAYRAPDGKKCAVGCLIPDEEYRYWFEGKLLCDIYNECPSLQEIDFRLLNSLQWIHDESPHRWWEEELKSVAQDYGLHYTERAI